MQSLTDTLQRHALTGSVSVAAVLQRCELLNSECERYLARAMAAEQQARDAQAAVEPLHSKVRQLEAERQSWKEEQAQHTGASALTVYWHAHLLQACPTVVVCVRVRA